MKKPYYKGTQRVHYFGQYQAPGGVCVDIVVHHEDGGAISVEIPSRLKSPRFSKIDDVNEWVEKNIDTSVQFVLPWNRH